MTSLRLTDKTLPIAIILVGLAVFLVDSAFRPGGGGSFLLNLLFWVAVVQGCVALVAAAELSKGRWIAPIKEDLLSVYPMLLFVAVLFALFGLRLNLYPWAGEGGVWLNKKFFILRNLALLLLLYGLARLLSREIISQGPRKNLYAVLYLFAFVTSQTLVAFDWVMSLEYPWFSTLFGGYFFIESLYAGIAAAGVAIYFLLKGEGSDQEARLRKTMKDVATLLFGFSLLWAGLFYSQFLVIWYGNLPEEVVFLTKRVTGFPLRELAFFSLSAMFFVPFVAFLPLRVKKSETMVLSLSSLILAGIFVERVVFVAPVVDLKALAFLLEFILSGALLVFIFSRRKELLALKGSP